LKTEGIEERLGGMGAPAAYRGFFERVKEKDKCKVSYKLCRRSKLGSQRKWGIHLWGPINRSPTRPIRRATPRVWQQLRDGMRKNKEGVKENSILSFGWGNVFRNLSD